MKSVNYFVFVIVCSFVFSLTGCISQSTTYAPVVDANVIEHIPESGVYHVLPGDTLFSIAWRYGLDYRYLANRNHIASPYRIEVGEAIYLRGNAIKTKVAHARMHPIEKTATPVIVESNTPVKRWNWPARGRVIGEFSALNKGINITGHVGEPIYATATGQVVYCGNGLRGYGNLIIIKHNNHFLSAYAHNRVVLVRQGEWVKARQKIAEMGDSGSTHVMLHFEIRLNGRPVNPLLYISR